MLRSDPAKLGEVRRSKYQDLGETRVNVVWVELRRFVGRPVEIAVGVGGMPVTEFMTFKLRNARKHCFREPLHPCAWHHQHVGNTWAFRVTGEGLLLDPHHRHFRELPVQKKEPVSSDRWAA
jgi:hypothetical protein